MKIVHFGNEGRQKLLKGVNLISEAIKSTLGPKGRNVTYGFHYGFPIVTKDGVTVARQVESRDPIEQLGLLLIRQVAQKTADDAGDGTTTASLLAQSIFTEGLKVLGTGANPILVKKGIDLAVIKAIEYIREHVKSNPNKEDLLKIAMISANNDKIIGDIIYEAISKSGDNGVITIEDNYSGSDTYIKTIEGMQLNEGYLSPYFSTDLQKMEANYQDPYILIADYEINHIQPLMKAVELIIGQEKKPLVIIANDVKGQALATLVANKHKQGLPLLACKAPHFGDNRTEQLTDLAILTGGRVVGHSTGLKFEDIELSDFGRADNILSSRHHTTITGGKGKKEDIDSRILVLQTFIDRSESDYEKEKLQERLAKLTSGVAVIKVGASTEVECKEKKMRVEDALHATRAAIEEGIVPGGGLMMLKASCYLKDVPADLTEEEKIGWKIIAKALQAPIKQIALNAGLDGSEIIANIISNKVVNKGTSKSFQSDNISGTVIYIPVGDINYGFNFLNNKYGDLIEMGVIDPFKVVRLTLENSASVAGTLLTTECVIAEEIEDEYTKTPRPKSE